MVLGLLACDGGAGSSVERPPEAAPPPALVVLTDRDLDAYIAGTRAEIRLLRQALRTNRALAPVTLDSLAARSAGMSVPRFHELTRAVDAALKNHTSLVRGAQLDSLRIELLVLRVRVDATR